MMDRNMRGRGMKFGGNVKRYANGGGIQPPKPPKSSQPPRPKYGINPPPLPPKKEKKPPKKPDPKNIQPPKVKPEPPKQKYKPMPIAPPKKGGPVAPPKYGINPPTPPKKGGPVAPPVRPEPPRPKYKPMPVKPPQAATQGPAKGRGVLGGLGDMLKKPTPPPRDPRFLVGQQVARQARGGMGRPMPRSTMRSGGKVHKYAEGGSIYRKGADGIATKGKTRGMTVRMRKGGMC